MQGTNLITRHQMSAGAGVDINQQGTYDTDILPDLRGHTDSSGRGGASFTVKLG